MNQIPKKILITGGNGFLGQHVQESLHNHGFENIEIATHDDYNLTNRSEVVKMYERSCPSIVIHLAAVVGGIGAHVHTSGQFLYENLIMSLEVMEQAREFEVEKFVNVGSTCSYPEICPLPIKEESLWTGFPNETTAPYGVAKLVAMLQGQYYRKQYGLNAIAVIPANVYGPKDYFDKEKSHVIPALILNCIEAKKLNKPLTVWGTGKATREFIYASDCADGIVLAIEKYNKPEVVNLGTGIETSIKEVVDSITSALDFKGEVIWDTTKPDGHPGRVFDISRAKKELDFNAKVDLQTGIHKTIDWYLNTL